MTPPTLTPAAFAAKWRGNTTTEKAGGGDGFAAVWKRGFFAWEYKGRRKVEVAPALDKYAVCVDGLGHDDPAQSVCRFGVRRR